LGGNVSALAVEGSFDDCQRLVKAALSPAGTADGGPGKKAALSSANSINVSRLIPQAAYYAAAAGRAMAGAADPDGAATPRLPGSPPPPPRVFPGTPITLCVPSGNFGNLTAGLYAVKMGAPVRRFIAATNANRTVPDYLASGEYLARESLATLSNAMDVGAPSNFERMTAHFSLEEMRRAIFGVWVSDAETRETIARVREQAGYFLDPHTAVGWKGAEKLAAELGPGFELAGNPVGILSTAHPAKFAETVEPLVAPLGGPPLPVPASLARAMGRTADSRTIPAELDALLGVLG